jgi:uncharacterized cupredoxin-like copper-binding protein
MKKPWLMLAVVFLVGCFALAACGDSGASAGPAGAKDVHITMAEMTIQSDVSTFTKGTPYHFIIENKGSMQHEFEIAKKQPPNATEAQMDSGRLAELERLDPGKTGTLDYTFTSSYAAGEMRLVCGMPGHYSAGQFLDITVS